MLTRYPYICMVYLMRLEMSSKINNVDTIGENPERRLPKLSPLIVPPDSPQNPLKEQGGLAQICSLKGGSKTRWILSCLGQAFPLVDPPSLPSSRALSPLRKKSQITQYPDWALWVADEGHLYPPALYHNWNIPLSQILMVKVPSAMDVWRVALESLQTALFRWVILRPSKSCSDAFLRKIQIETRKVRRQVFILSNATLAHWTLQKIQVSPSTLSPQTQGAPHGQDPLFTKQRPTKILSRSMLGSYSKSLYPKKRVTLP